MAKKKGKTSRFKIQRHLGTELPGLGKAGALDRRPYPPGENGNKRRKFSDYALRLEEKQKVRHHYGLTEKQLRRFIRDAKTGSSTSSWIVNLINRLERRTDNVIFRLGLAPSMRAAKQLISHKHVLIDGKTHNIASAVLKNGTKISLKDKAYENQIVLQARQSPRMEVPDFLKKEDNNNKEFGTVIAEPGLEHIPFSFEPGLFTEYYAARKV